MIALTRAVPPSIVRCELTHVAREPIDVARATAQHDRYEDALREAGFRIEHVAPAPEMPDSVFIEDTAVVFDETAIIARPGAESRRRETPAVEAALGRYRPLAKILSPGTLDGGDVLTVGRRVFVGISTRTNTAAVDQMRDILAPLGYTVIGIPVARCLHLKSAATALDEDRLILNPAWIDGRAFAPLSWIEVPASEPAAATVLRAGEAVIVAAETPRTIELLARAGYDVQEVPAAELAKAEGGLTCCSLLIG